MPEGSLLKNIHLTKRVSELRKDYFRAVPEICIERPKLITQFSLLHGLLSQERISILDKARTYRYVLKNRTSIVRHSWACEKDEREKKLKTFELEDRHLSLFAGSTTSKFKGVPLYPEFLALTLWPELWTISRRRSNPYYLSGDEVQVLNYEVFPHWINHNILELARKRCFEENLSKTKGKKEKHAPEIMM